MVKWANEALLLATWAVHVRLVGSGTEPNLVVVLIASCSAILHLFLILPIQIDILRHSFNRDYLREISIVHAYVVNGTSSNVQFLEHLNFWLIF